MSDELAVRVVPRSFVGTYGQVSDVLERATRQGRLISSSPIHAVGPDEYRVELIIVMPDYPPAPPAQRPAQRRTAPRRYTVALLAILAALGALVALGALIVALIDWVLAHAVVLVAVAAGLAVLALVLGTLASHSGRCGGLHCSGCGHR
ncbi:hypothetical protein [Actinoplanes sp. NPDC051859]|uniref:hypothetical protein n=1 Tax=Actinoplanes sp. NPDC051859 TaxID=3363909 RepID=UPI00378D549A